jgi:hypothetical protein
VGEKNSLGFFIAELLLDYGATCVGSARRLAEQRKRAYGRIDDLLVIYYWGP